MNNGSNRIDPTPVRLSTNVTIDRQTPKADFGDRLKAGVTNTANAVAGGANMVAPLVPGAGIVSAAVSGVGGVTNSSNGNASSSVGRQYLSLSAGSSLGGSRNIMVGGAGTGGINTTADTGGSPTGGTGGVIPAGASTSASSSTVDGLTVNSANTGGFGQDSVSEMAAESQQLLQLQFQMQQETQYFETISNVLKTRADTAKNSIGNIH